MDVREPLSHIEALHTFARRYCLERSHLLRSSGGWRVGYDLGIDQPVVGPKDIDPRCEVLDYILMAVEGFTAPEFASPEDMVDRLCSAAQTARSPNVTPYPSAKSPAAIKAEEERDRFCRHMRENVHVDLSGIEPLPFRRTLDDEEVRQLNERIGAKWNGVFDHIGGGARPEGILLLQSAWFDAEVSSRALRQALHGHGEEHVWFLPALGANVEIELSLFEPGTQATYPLWAGERLDWLIYRGAEDGSIAFAGEWLIDTIKWLWPNWEQRVYSHWDYPRPTHRVAADAPEV